LLFDVHWGSFTSLQAQAAHFRFSRDSGRVAASHRSATNRLTRDEARRMTVLRQAAAAVASVAADKRGVDRVAAADAAMHYLSRRPKAEVH
jgi:hypothetical protein